MNQQDFTFPGELRQPPPPLPERGNVQDFPARAAPPPVRPPFRMEPEPSVREEDVGPALLEMAQAIAHICATRVLLLLALVVASALWSVMVWQPTEMRMYAVVGFSALIVLPLVLLYWKRG